MATPRSRSRASRQAASDLWLWTKAPSEEDANGEVYRSGCVCGKYDVRGNWRKRQAAQLARGGDDRTGAGGAAQGNPGEEARVSRGGDTEQLDLRDPLAARGGDCGCNGLGEPRPEERRARRLCSGGAITHGQHKAHGIQGDQASTGSCASSGAFT